MANNDIGYHEDPKNGNDIKRARTTKQIRSWELPRNIKALEALNNEYGKLEFPSIYVLFEGKSKVYVGEAKNVYNRVKTHINTLEDKIKNWDTAIVINDGRPASQSDFNDNVIRKSLELYLINLLKANKYNVVAQGESQILNATQKTIVTALIEELNFFLLKKNIITKFIEVDNQQEIFRDELKKTIERSGRKVEEWTTYEALVDGQKFFIRPGSKKPKGWQITFRGRKSGSFIDCLQRGEGYLLVSRGSMPLIPLSEVKNVIKDETAYDQDTIDIWIVFKEDRITLSYKKDSIDITDFRLIK